MTAILDYKAGNVTSVELAFAAIGEKAVRISPETDGAETARICLGADRLVIPGVGAAGKAMEYLEERNLADVLRRRIAAGGPTLGICLGMQLMFAHSEEDGGVDCLGVIPGIVRRFPATPGFKIPQIGWNQVDGGTEYYFVHSYYAEKGEWTTGVTEYAGVEFSSAVKSGSLVAYQFHPEKSGRAGLELLKEFASC